MNITLNDLISFLIAVFFLIAYLLFIFFSRYHKKSKERTAWSQRLSKTLGPTIEKKIKTSIFVKETSEIETYFTSKLPKIEGLTQWIQHAGLEIKPVVLISISIGGGFVIFFILLFILKLNLLFSFLLSSISIFVIPWIVITFLTKLKKNQFLEEFPTALDMIHRALRAGHSSERAFEMVAKNPPGPFLGEIFRQLSDKIRLGEPPEVVLTEISNRLGIDEFRMFSIALVLQRETGGSFAETIDNFSKIIRARRTLQKKMKALTGEVRATALILTSIPFCIAGLIFVMSPHYLDVLFDTQGGHLLLIIGGSMLTIGITIIFRLAYKDIY